LENVKLKFDERHGGPYDRGGADSYYRRKFDPHYYVGDTRASERVEADQMTQEEVEAYTAGYFNNEELGYYKDY
jgi:hypothetical protein